MHYATISDRLGGLGSDKWAVHLKAREMAKAGINLLELTIGEPDIAPDPILAEVMADALEKGRVGYSDGRGEAPLLDALAGRYSARTGRAITRENIVCFPGTQTALFAVMMTLVEKGDAVLVGDPLYATYEGSIRATGADMATVPLKAEDGFHMQAEALERAIVPHARVLLLNTPHNPTGAVLTRGEIAAIGAVCARHDLWIVADEVYEELIFGGEFASPLDNDDLRERTVVVSSISKSHAAPGFRSGWAIGPEAFCKRLLPVAETMLFGNQPFIADATAAAILNPSGVSEKLRSSLRRACGVAGRSAGRRRRYPLRHAGGRHVCTCGCLRDRAFRRGVRARPAGKAPCRRHARIVLRRRGRHTDPHKPYRARRRYPGSDKSHCAIL